MITTGLPISHTGTPGYFTPFIGLYKTWTGLWTGLVKMVLIKQLQQISPNLRWSISRPFKHSRKSKVAYLISFNNAVLAVVIAR